MSMVLEKDKNRLVIHIPNSEATISAQIIGIKNSEVTGYYTNDKITIKNEIVDFLKDDLNYILNVKATLEVITTLKNNILDYNNIFKDNLISLESSFNYFKSLNTNYYSIPKMFYSGVQNRYFKFENSNVTVKKLKEILYGDITGLYISKEENYYLVTPFVEEDYLKILAKKKTKILKSSEDKLKFWLYTLNESKWNYCLKNNVIVIDGDEIKDYVSKEAMIEDLKNNYKNIKSIDEATALYDFIKNIDKGDIIIVKLDSILLGYGMIIDNDYYYDETKEKYKHVRHIEWVKKGEWNIPENMKMPHEMLANITLDGDFAVKLFSIMEGEVE